MYADVNLTGKNKTSPHANEVMLGKRKTGTHDISIARKYLDGRVVPVLHFHRFGFPDFFMEEERDCLNGRLKQAQGHCHPDTSCDEITDQHGNGDVHNVIAKGFLEHTLVVIHKFLDMSHGVFLNLCLGIWLNDNQSYLICKNEHFYVFNRFYKLFGWFN